MTMDDQISKKLLALTEKELVEIYHYEEKKDDDAVKLDDDTEKVCIHCGKKAKHIGSIAKTY